MKNSKIVQILKCFSKEEIKEFGKFIGSPFHNNRKDLIKHYDLLKKFYPDFDDNKITKEYFFSKLNPGKKYDSDIVDFFNSHLFNLAKEFSALTYVKDDNFFYRYHLLRSLDKRNADSLYEREFRNAEDYLNENSLSEDIFHQKGMLEELRINFNLKRNRQDKICQNTIDYADYSIYSFLVKLAIMYHDMLADKITFNFEFKDSTTELFIKNFNFQEFIKNLKIENTGLYNYLAFYYYLFMSHYNSSDHSYYPLLKEFTFKDFDKLNEAEKSGRFHYIINYCILQMESGNFDFLSETFNLYRERFEKITHKSGGSGEEIGLIFFRNFVMIGLAAKEYKYVENFIFENGNKLQGAQSKDVLEICYAMLHFEKKEYETALNYLSKMDYSYPALRLGMKHLYIKIYYEINDHSSFFPLADAYKHYLKNDKTIPSRVRQLHTNFLNYTGRLAKVKFSSEHNGSFILEKEIKSDDNLDFRHKLWLLEKASELNEKKK